MKRAADSRDSCGLLKEFAVSMAIDGDKSVVSYGVDGHVYKIAVTSLLAVLEMLSNGAVQ